MAASDIDIDEINTEEIMLLCKIFFSLPFLQLITIWCIMSDAEYF